MRKMKRIIAGQIALILIGCCHYKGQMTGQEKEDYDDLKQCADILNRNNEPESNYSANKIELNQLE